MDNPGGRPILSLDAVKAYDSVEWPYLLDILSRFGIGNTFINWISVLYSAPCARLRINNALSSSFSLHRGTRQGCPLSPLLFAMAVEPLAVLIRKHPSIIGFHRGTLEDKIYLYVDDVLLYLGKTGESLHIVMRLISDFGAISGFTINWSKSVLMPLDPLTAPFSDRASQIVDSF